jgi:two-component system, chemotaxis family, protein-glutamate methylesterase/glutaminase
MSSYGIVVVGTSWGGLAALRALVAGLPGDFPLPVALVQHRHRSSDGLLSRLLQELTPLPVCEAEDKMAIVPGQIVVAPADYHLLLEEGYYTLTTDAPVRFSRPSIDVTFSSAADVFAERTLGVVLTGANDDGAAGLRRIVARGGLAVVEDPASAESRAMPAAALAAVPDAVVRALPEIPAYLASIARETVVAWQTPVPSGAPLPPRR